MATKNAGLAPSRALHCNDIDSSWTRPVHSQSDPPRTRMMTVTHPNRSGVLQSEKSKRSVSMCQPNTLQSTHTDTAAVSYGGLEYTFVEEVSDELVCSVCTKVFKVPHLTDCCGHHYCYSCLQHWIASGVSDTCPSCRSHDFNHIHDKKLERKINELKIQCTNADQGCAWEGPISELTRHLNVGSNSIKGCQFVMCECERQCGEVMLRKEINVHLQATCPLREVTCEHCKQTFTYQDIVRLHFMTCVEKAVLCDNDCGELLKRKDMKAHQESSCPNAIIKCPFVDVGCCESVARKDRDHHIAVCKENYLTSTVLKMKEELSAQREELVVAREENQLLRKEFIRLKRGVLISHNNLDILHRYSNTMRDVISSELPFLHTSCASPSEQLALDCIRTQINGSPVHLESGRGCATFRMTHYATHKQTGLVWYTPSFHVANGYTMCFGVHLNGVGAGKGTHVSLYLYQLTGLYDSELKWPYLLEEDFQVCLMSQIDKSGGRSRSPRRTGDKSKLGRLAFSPKQKHKTSNTSTVEPQQMKTLTLPTEFGEREVELVKTKSLPSNPVRNDTMSASNHSNERECSLSQYVVEHQVLCVSQYISQPVQSSCSTPIAKLELFCLQKTVENVVYRDSIVFQCCLNVKQDTEECPPPVTGGERSSGWKTWSGDDV